MKKPQSQMPSREEPFDILPPSPESWDRLSEIYREIEDAPDFLDAFSRHADEMMEETDKNIARGHAWLDQVEARIRDSQRRKPSP